MHDHLRVQQTSSSHYMRSMKLCGMAFKAVVMIRKKQTPCTIICAHSMRAAQNMHE